MIIEFTLQNFRSFKDKFTLSLEAESLKSNTNKLIEASNDTKLLPSVGIFGGNASGKSNIIKALEFMTWAMQNSDYIKNPTTKHELLSPFRLDGVSVKKPIFLQLVIWDSEEEKEYCYGFEINDEIIVREWLKINTKVKKNFTDQEIFTRDKQKITFGSKVDKAMKQLEARVRPDALALSVFTQFNDKLSARLVSLVNKQSLYIAGSKQIFMYNDALRLCDDDEQLRHDVTQLILKADLSIQEIDIKKRDAFNELSNGISSEFARAMKNDLKFTVREAITKHKQYGKSSEYVNFNLGKDESVGTRQFFALATQIVNTLKNGGILVVDDLGSSLHPFISEVIVKQFDNKKTNPNSAQLIYNSHEINLLSKSANLRRDQIWFTDKNDKEEACLRCLSEYKTKNDYDIARNYLAGRFGAVPFLEFDEESDE